METTQRNERAVEQAHLDRASDLTVGPEPAHGPGRSVGAARRMIQALMILLSLISAAIAADRPEGRVATQIDELLKSVRRHTVGRGYQAQSSSEEPRLVQTESGYVRALEAPSSGYFAVSSAVPGNAQATARSFLDEHRAAFGMTDGDLSLVRGKTSTQAQRSHVRFDQTFAGIPVFGAETVVQLNEDGVEYVLSDIATDAELPEIQVVPLSPTISRVDAEQIATGMMLLENLLLQFQASPATLMVYEPSIIGTSGPAHLVWYTEVTSVPDPFVSEAVLVDAHTGEIALRYSLTNDALYRAVYDANGSTSGYLKRKEGDAPYVQVEDVDLAYDYLCDTYNFYLSVHGRDSIDNAGMALKVLVRYCPPGASSPYANAFWNGEGLIFGEHFVTDDGVGHEYTHGVTQFESNLLYVTESGAINESFSDMWGEWIDQTNGRGDDSTAVRWLIGEDLSRWWSRNDGKRMALRSMKNPPDYYQPDIYGGVYWQNYLVDDTDKGGVHTNAGVNNKLCYLLTDGDTFNGITVQGMGYVKVAKLYYEVQTDLLPRAADYQDLCVALRRAAENLGWTLGEKSNLEAACKAVGIDVGPHEVVDDKYDYDSSDTPKDIPDTKTITSQVYVPDAGTITDLNVQLLIEHTYDADLDVYLIAPDGTQVELFTDVGGSGDHFIGTILDNDAPESIRDAAAPFDGYFRPEGNLDDFNGRSMKGTWTLKITDDDPGAAGKLHGWSLFITASAGHGY
jgi:Zn-dependent metalloprotease/subtilisin-like proprotein convertase family protein